MKVPVLLLAAGLSAVFESCGAQDASISGFGNHGPRIPGKVAAAWYAGWHTADFPLSKVPWSKYTHLTYAFAITTPDVRTLSLEGSSPETLPNFVREARKHNVKALISVGGWTGSRFFSTAVATPQNRTAFVKTVVGFVQKYNLDGVDFDWEYPASQGIGCNTISTADTANFLLFLQELRKNPIGSKIILTAATATRPFTGPDGAPSASVAPFAKVLDYFALMNYDIWGPWSATVGPNAPLNDTCAAPENQQGLSAVNAVQAWSGAGVPKDQLVLAVAGYGHGFRVPKANAFVNGSTTVLKPYPAFDGDAWDDGAGPDVCGVVNPNGGNFNFWGLIANGFLKADGTPAPGIGYRYDSCSQTPYVYNPTTEIMVSFDNAQSFAAKGNFIKNSGLKGFALWEAGGDSNSILLNSIRGAVGFR
ncbi:chitinase [Ephemerocybe angulata]|uniref:Chitinase n=1 Tax=Ephemerocybe angulata TaxID=980116 RepID=A0A8H6IBS7_9AGAR|nr:chitinase [Tulosesus angulatus]